MLSFFKLNINQILKIKPLRLCICFVIIIMLTLCFYWIKSQIGINFFETVSLSKYYPFKYLYHPKIIDINRNGVLLNENFDVYHIFKKWRGIYIEGKGKVIKSISTNRMNLSRCLLVTNNEVKSWSISNICFVQVKIGDHFSYSAKVKISDGNPVAKICVDSFDENRKIIKWGYSKMLMNDLNKWVEIDNDFSIDDEQVRYIRFRISGVGKGAFRFDDIILKRDERIK